MVLGVQLFLLVAKGGPSRILGDTQPGSRFTPSWPAGSALWVSPRSDSGKGQYEGLAGL